MVQIRSGLPNWQGTRASGLLWLNDGGIEKFVLGLECSTLVYAAYACRLNQEHVPIELARTENSALSSICRSCPTNRRHVAKGGLIEIIRRR